MAELQRELTKPVIEIRGSDSDDDPQAEAVSTPQADAAEASCVGVSVWQTLLSEPAPTESKFSGIRKAAQQRQCDIERRLLKNFQIEHRVSEALRARKTFSDVCRIVQGAKVVTSVKRQDLPDLKVSYRDQGNLDMYTAANLKKRDANRHHPEVIEALDQFWNILPKLPNGKINKAIYSWMYRKMYFQMVKTATEIEFQNVVAEDWRQDALFGNYMNIRMFRQAIFNTADVWCETLEPEEYRDFIRHLRKVVEAGAPFQGKLELEDDEVMPAGARRGRRASAVPPPDFNDDPFATANPAVQHLRSVQGTAAPNANPDEEIAALLADEEELCQETFETETLATAEMLRALYDQAETCQCVSEEIMLLKAGLIRQKQLKMFGDLGNEATFEEKYIDVIASRQADRAARREAMLRRVEAAELEQANLEVRGGSHASRLAARTKIHEDTMNEHFRFFDILRDMTYRASTQQRDWDSQMAKMETQRLELKKAVHVNPYDTEHVLYIGYRSQSTSRFTGYLMVVKDLLSSDVIAVTRDLQDARVLLSRLGHDSLHAELSNTSIDEGTSHFQREQEDSIALGSRRWLAICDLFDRNHRLRNEWSTDRLETIRETCRTIKAFEAKALRQWSEEQEKNDAAWIKLIEEDKTITGAHRDSVLRDAQKAARERAELRQSRLVALQADHQQLDEDLGLLTSGHDELVDAQNRLLKSWTAAESFTDLKLMTVEYVEILDCGKVPSALSNTVMTRPTTKLAVSLGGTAYLPTWVTSTLELAMFLYQEEMEWFGFHLERLLAERVRFLLRLASRMDQRWLEELTYLADMKVAFRLRRVSDIDEYPSIMPAAGFLDREIMKQRIEGAAVAKAKLQRTLEWRDESLLEAQQIIESDGRASYELRIVLSRIFEVERTFRDRHITVQLKWCRLAQQRRSVDRIKLLAAEAAGDTPAETKNRNALREARIHEVQERRQRIQQEEIARREADRLRADQLAEQKQEAARRQRDQLVAEQRKKLLEASEQRQKERLKKEREEREKWHQEYLRQEQARKRELEEKKAWSEYRKQPKAMLEPGGPRVRRGSRTPSDSPVTEDLQPKKEEVQPKKETLAPAPKVVRRKSVDGTTPSTTPKGSTPQPTMPTQPAQPAKKPATKPTAKPASKPISKPARAKLRRYVPLDTPLQTEGSMSPHESVQLTLKQKYGIGELNTSAAQRDFITFSDRRQYYLAEQMSNRDIYTKQCKTNNVAPDADFLFNLSSEPLLYKMTSATFSNRSVHLPSVLDVILFNPIQHLYLRKCSLKLSDIQLLCETLVHCNFLSHIDLRNNDLDDAAGAYILSLVKQNHKISKVDLDGNQIADITLSDIAMICESNSFGRDIGRSEFDYIRSVFNEMDTDGSGMVTLKELRAFAEREKAKSNGLASPTLSRGKSTRELMNATVEKRVQSVRQHLCSLASKQGTGDFSLADLICFIFPHWSVNDADAVVAKYSADAGGPTLHEMEEFMDTFGKNGTLSLQQLATGLGENTESLRTVFGEYDVDNDGKLSLEEFMRFMSA